MKNKFLLLAFLFVIFSAQPVLGQNEQLAETFAPVLKFNGGELFYVSPVEYHVSSSNLMQGDSLISSSPTTSSISGYSAEDYYLDNKLGGFAEIASDYGARSSALAPTVYYHIVQDGAYTAIQYWFFYPFNNGPLNEHEGDWENIVVVLNNGVPEWAAYSEHVSGERLKWSEVERTAETHPIVYVARGSHANYFRPYEGRFGFHNDDVGGNGVTLYPQSLGGNIQLVSLDSNPSWLGFGGRWGDFGDALAGIRGGRGPFGPSAGEHSSAWNNPNNWAMSVPETNGGMFILSWLVYNFALLVGIYVVIRIAIKCFGIYRTAKSENGLQVKNLLSSAFSVWFIIGLAGTALVTVGMLTTWYQAQGDIQSAEIQTGGKVDLVRFNGLDGISVNTLEKGKGMTSLFSMGIPIGLVLLAGILMTFLDLIGTKSGPSLGKKYLLGGIMPIVMFILVIVFVVSLSSLLPSIQPMLGKEGVPPEAATLITSISSSPISGGYQGPMGGYAQLNIGWGLGIGAYLLLIGGIMKILAGILMIAASPKVKTKAVPQQQVMHQVIIQPPQQYQPAQATALACAKCGTILPPGERFCPNCGVRVAQ